MWHLKNPVLLCKAIYNCLYMLKPIEAYKHYLIGPLLVQAMACCLFSAKSLPEPMMTFCHSNIKEHEEHTLL